MASKKAKHAEAEVAEGEATEGKKGTNRILLDVDGEQVARTDYIRKRWAEGAARGVIRKEVSKLQGKEIAFQIIYAATKGVEGGPAKEEAESAE